MRRKKDNHMRRKRRTPVMRKWSKISQTPFIFPKLQLILR
jgi:hypothetical protein